MASLEGLSCSPIRAQIAHSSHSFPAATAAGLSIFPCVRQSISITKAAQQQTETADTDAFRLFLRERELNGDFISRACDKFWYKSEINLLHDDLAKLDDEVIFEDQDRDSENEDGFLKMSKMRDWVVNDMPAPMSRNLKAKDFQDDSDMRKELNLLNYEALKKELIFLSIGIGAGCTAYCWAVFSLKAAASYAVGVAFSCLYLQLLYQHVDKLSKEMVPQIFLQKRIKKIGIRSQDLQDAIQKWVKGCSISLSSPRLMIPATIFGLWVLCHRLWTNDFLDFQLVPAMLGMFVYKAAALVQVYRDNEDLELILPED